MTLSASASHVGQANPPIALDIEPFDVAQTLDGGQAFGWYGNADSSYRGVMRNQVVDIGCDSRGVWYRTECEPSEDVRTRIEDYLGVSDDVASVISALSAEPSYGEDLCRLPLIRILRQNPWECLVGFICSQNSNIPRIKQMVASVARLGRQIGSDDWAYELPEPEVVARTGETGLRAIGLGYRAKHLAPTAAILANGVDLDGLRGASYHDAKDALMELPGIGPKVADCILAYSLDKGEAFPVDVHVRRAAIRLYGLDEKIKNDALGEWARDRFGDYSAYAQLYMFRDEINRRANGG